MFGREPPRPESSLSAASACEGRSVNSACIRYPGTTVGGRTFKDPWKIPGSTGFLGHKALSNPLKKGSAPLGDANFIGKTGITKADSDCQGS